MNYVLLDKPLMARAIARAERHHVDAITHQRSGIWQDGLTKHVVGACGELAVAIWTGKPWTGEHEFHSFNGADVGADIQVKTRDMTRNLACRDLYLFANNPASYRYVLVCRELPRLFVLHGWIWGYAAKQSCYWHKQEGNRRAAYWIPRSALQEMETL